VNIFFLDTDTKQCAKYHCDKHVVKMILEYCQLLSTAHRVLDGDELEPWMDETLYKVTHKNHPSSVWVRQNARNYQYVFDLLYSLSQEYRQRYGKGHKSWDNLKFALCMYPKNIPLDNIKEPLDLSEAPQCMPDEYKDESTVQAYRNYYNGGKAYMAKWKNSVTPEWFKPEVNNEQTRA
jgi:hypothetical protein